MHSNEEDMKYDLRELVTHPDLPLAHRMREPQSGRVDGSPCLLLLHGVGANEAGLAELAAQQDPRLTVILVRSPIQFGPLQFGFFQVNFTQAGPVINAEQAEQSRQLLASFIEGLPSAYGIDPKKIWIAGFSQGGILSASIGLTRPDLVRGFGILSGRILPEIGPHIAGPDQLAGLHAFVSHGVNDGKLTIEFARNAQKLLAEKQVALTYREYNAAHEFNVDMQRDFRGWLSQELDKAGASK
jgi:phospholipase/carboxylesterase